MMTLIFIRWSVWSDDDQVMIISRHTTVTSSFARPICQPDTTGSCLLSKNSQSSFIKTCKNHQTEKRSEKVVIQNCKIHDETLQGVVDKIHFHSVCNHHEWLKNSPMANHVIWYEFFWSLQLLFSLLPTSDKSTSSTTSWTILESTR